MNTEELEPVNYLSELENMRRVTHEVDGLEHIPEPENLTVNDLEKLDQQEKLCKRIMAALDVKIQNIQDTRRKVNNR